MEFFEKVNPVTFDVLQLQSSLSIQALPEYCQSIDKVLVSQGNSGKIYCLWGEFVIHREEIQRGLRFSLPGCPNALAWTITLDDSVAQPVVVIHCTIDKQSHDEDFIDSIRVFISDFAQGISKLNDT